MSTVPARAEDRAATVWRTAARSHVGLVRRINEDRVFDGGLAGVWAVVDGMGGYSGGDLAAQQTVDTLRHACTDAIGPDALVAALQEAHAAIATRNRRLRLEAGATVVATVLADDALTVAWAGDSRAYWIDAGGVTQLTRDHSLVQQLIDAGRIDAATAATHPGAHVVTRALGIGAEVAIDRVTVPATPGRLLLCSDGLSRTLCDADLGHDGTLDAVADRLIAGALVRDGSDNVSLVLVEFA